MRADALRLVASSAEQAAARLQFCRIAFGAAGSAGAELDLNEIWEYIAQNNIAAGDAVRAVEDIYLAIHTK